MTLVVAHQAESIFLANILEQQTGELVDIRLFSNNVTPTPSFTEGSLTEVSGGGYSLVSLTASNWTITGTNPVTATYNSAINFIFTGAPSTNGGNVYGYYATARSGTNAGKMLWADRFTNAPIIIANNGDEISITTMTIGLANSGE